jgi:hypothetical protein
VPQGADFGFMSTTLDRKVALEYSNASDKSASTVLKMTMVVCERRQFLLALHVVGSL